MTECGTLIRVETVTSQLATCHSTNSMDEVSMIEIFKSILVRVMGVGTTVEIVCQGVLNTVLVASILRDGQNTRNGGHQGTYTILLLIVQKRSYDPTSVGTIAGLTTDTDSGTTNAKMVNGAGDSVRRRRHCKIDEEVGSNRSG